MEAFTMRSRKLETYFVLQEAECHWVQLSNLSESHPLCCSTVGGMPPAPSLTYSPAERASTVKTQMIRGLAKRAFLGSSQLYFMHAQTADQREHFLSALDSTLADLKKGIIAETLPRNAGTPTKQTGFARSA